VQSVILALHTNLCEILALFRSQKVVFILATLAKTIHKNIQLRLP